MFLLTTELAAPDTQHRTQGRGRWYRPNQAFLGGFLFEGFPLNGTLAALTVLLGDWFTLSFLAPYCSCRAQAQRAPLFLAHFLPTTKLPTLPKSVDFGNGTSSLPPGASVFRSLGGTGASNAPAPLYIVKGKLSFYRINPFALLASTLVLILIKL